MHRDFGFFFIGTTLIYAVSGIALNHMDDWDPNYQIENKEITLRSDLSKENFSQDILLEELKQHDLYEEYTNHYLPRENILKIFLDGRSSVLIDTEKNIGHIEQVRKRPVFYQTNYLHYNPNVWWNWYSDLYASVLVLFVVTSFFMVRGKFGIKGRGGIYTAAGIIIPLLILFLS